MPLFCTHQVTKCDKSKTIYRFTVAGSRGDTSDSTLVYGVTSQRDKHSIKHCKLSITPLNCHATRWPVHR